MIPSGFGGPILPLKTRHASKLRGIRGYECGIAAERLGRDEQVVRPNRGSRSLQGGPQIAGSHRVLLAEGIHRDASGQEYAQPLGVLAAARAASNAVPKLVQYNGRDGDRATLGDGATQALAKYGRFVLQQRDDGVRIEQVAHVNRSSASGLGG